VHLDFFTVPTIRFQFLYVFLVLEPSGDTVTHCSGLPPTIWRLSKSPWTASSWLLEASLRRRDTFEAAFEACTAGAHPPVTAVYPSVGDLNSTVPARCSILARPSRFGMGSESVGTKRRDINAG